MKIQQDKIIKSLKRVEGQVRGVEKMYVEGKACLEVVQQMAAAREALNRVVRELLKREACKCMVNRKDKVRFEKILERLFKS